MASIQNATAIGAGAVATVSNTVVLGVGNSIVIVSGDLKTVGDIDSSGNIYSSGRNFTFGVEANAPQNPIPLEGRTIIGYNTTIDGNLFVNGTITENNPISKNTIDNPLDPANKKLTLPSIQSPDLVNIYSGNATTDANGEAVITLPSYTEASNKDFRYQLTVLGTFAQAIVASEISQNTFKIKTDKPNIKVSWQVTGVRKDAAAEKTKV